MESQRTASDTSDSQQHGESSSDVDSSTALRRLLTTKAMNSRLITLFDKWDHNNDQTIDKREFRRAVRQLGCDNDAKEINSIFDELDASGSGKLGFQDFCRLRKLDRSLSPQRIASNIAEDNVRQREARAASQEQQAAKDSPRAEKVLRKLRAKMDRDSLRVVDIFRRMDPEGQAKDGVTKDQLRRALAREIPGGVSKKLCDAAFRTIEATKASHEDADGSKKITIGMLKDALPSGTSSIGKRVAAVEARKERAAAKQKAQAERDEQQVFDVLRRLRRRMDRDALRIVDVFRRWAEGSTKVSYAQFCKGLGLDVEVLDREACDAVWRSIDINRNGLITLDEMVAAISQVPYTPRRDWPRARSPRTSRRANKQESDSALALLDDLRAYMETHGLRVIDLFNKFDERRTGSVDSETFRKGVEALGLSSEACENVFASMDTARAGYIMLSDLRGKLHVPGLGLPRPRPPSPRQRETVLPDNVRIPEEAASLSSDVASAGSPEPIAVSTLDETTEVSSPTPPPKATVPDSPDEPESDGQTSLAQAVELSQPHEVSTESSAPELDTELAGRISSMRKAFGALFGDGDEEDNDQPGQLESLDPDIVATEAPVDASLEVCNASVPADPVEAEPIGGSVESPLVTESFQSLSSAPQVLGDVEDLSWAQDSAHGILSAVRIPSGRATCRGHTFRHSRQCDAVDRRRDCVLADRVFDDGGVHRWAFTILPARGGNSSSIRVGVAEADVSADVKAWGLRPHLQGKVFAVDALYGNDVRLLGNFESNFGRTAMSAKVVCEVDLAEGTLRFGSNDGPLITIEGVRLPPAVVPWCCISHQDDAVTLSSYRRSTDHEQRKTSILSLPGKLPISAPPRWNLSLGSALYERRELQTESLNERSDTPSTRGKPHKLLDRWSKLQAHGAHLKAKLASEESELKYGPQRRAEHSSLLEKAQREAEEALEALRQSISSDTDVKLRGEIADRHAAKAAGVSLEAYLGVGHESLIDTGVV